MDPIQIVVESLEQFWSQFGVYLPRVIAALILLIAGWIVARLVRRITIKVLKLIRVDVLAEKAGIEDFLVQGGVRYTAVTIIASLVYWLILFTVILSILNSLGLQAAERLFDRVILYIPNVMIAILVLLFGSLLGKFVQTASFTYLNNIGVEGAAFISHAAQWAIMIFVASVALEQLAIGGQVLVSAFQIAFGALCLALALAFGLGGRRWAARILDRIWKT